MKQETHTTGRLIRARREAAGLTQRELAQRLHITDKAVSKWERDLSLPDTALLIPLAECLGVTEGELLRGEEAPPDRPLRAELDAVRRRLPPAGPVVRHILLWALLLAGTDALLHLAETFYYGQTGRLFLDLNAPGFSAASAAPYLALALASCLPPSLWVGLRLGRRAQEVRPFPGSGSGFLPTWLRYGLPWLALAAVLMVLYLDSGLGLAAGRPLEALVEWEATGPNTCQTAQTLHNLPYFVLSDLLIWRGPAGALAAYGAYSLRKAWYMSRAACRRT